MRHLLSILVLVSLAMPAGAAEDVRVAVEDNVFVPAAVDVAVGQRVAWATAPGAEQPHNVRQDDRLFRSGPPTTAELSYARTFTAGTFGYFCEAHGSPSGGMTGVVRVVPIVRERADGRFLVRWSTSEAQTGSRFDVQYRTGAKKWTWWLRDTTSARGLADGAGETAFRVRSRRGDAVSGWSPPASA